MELPIIAILFLTGFGFICHVSGEESWPVLKFDVTNGNISCILAEFSGKITIGTNQTFILNGTKSDLSSCELETLDIYIFGDGEPTLSFRFKKENNKVSFHTVFFMVNSITYNFFGNSSESFSVASGNTWKCDTGLKLNLLGPAEPSAKLELKNIRFNAFRSATGSSFENEISCSAEASSNKMVPMIIAFVLGGMVIIMLVGYIILRRKEDKSVYQTV